MRYAGLTLASSSNEAAGPLSLQDRFNKVRNRPHPFKRFTPLHSGVGCYDWPLGQAEARVTLRDKPLGIRLGRRIT
jgi:hypothetical protein